MNYLKKIGRSFAYMFIFLFSSLFIITLFNYIGFFSSTISNIMKFIFFLFSLFLGGFINGKNSTQNGWLEGIKLGSIFTVFLLLINLIFFSFKVTNIIYYLIVLGTITFGSMVGINKKVETTH